MFDWFVPLFITLIVILAASLIRFRFDFMEPAIIFVATLTFSVSMAMIFAERWQLSIGLRTFFCLTFAALAFVGGSVFAEKCSRARSIGKKKSAPRIGNMKIALTLLVMLALLIFNFIECYEMSLELGNAGGVADMIRVNRAAIEAQKASFSRWLNYRSMLAQAITCIFFYVFARNFIELRAVRLKYLLPLLFYIPILILSTGRMGLLCLVVYMVVVASIIYQNRRGQSIAIRLSTAKALLGAGLIFAVLFMLMGFFTGKTVSETRTPAVIIAHYAGLSIPALDVFLNREIVETPLIGSQTLHGVYRAFNSLGIALPRVPLFLPFVHFYNIDTNVYTAEARYIHDYGWLGMSIILWSFGAIYAFAYRYVRDRASTVPLMFYGVCAYPLFLSSIDERVMLDLFSTTPIYMLILLWLGNRILVRDD